jgi:hypothetical protein
MGPSVAYAACETVWVKPPTVIVPERAERDPFEATLNWTVPLPVPDAVVTVIHLTSVEADQPQWPPLTVTLKEPVPPARANDDDVEPIAVTSQRNFGQCRTTGLTVRLRSR